MNELPNILCSLIIVLAFPFFRHAFFFRPPWRIETKKPSKRIQFFDVLRGIAIIAVIGIHTIDFYRLELGIETTDLLLINAFLRFAIPLFLIASGMLLDPRDLQNGQSRALFYWRKLVRIFIPYVVLTLLWSMGGPDFSLTTFLLHLIRGNVLLPYYFVIVLFELYLLYPFLIQFAARRWFLYASLGISMCAVIFRFRYISGIPLPFEYLFFFAYGIALRPLLVTARKPKMTMLHPWLCIAGFYFIGFFAVPDYYYNTVYFWGLAMFWILFLQQQHLPEVVRNSLAYVGRFSLWIFLLHYPILFWIGKGQIAQIQTLPRVIVVILLTGSTLVISLLLAVPIASALKVGGKALRAVSGARSYNSK